MRAFVRELRRRHVFRVAAVYAGVAFITVQVADITFPALQLPSWTVTLVVVLALLGFPFAVVLAWAYDITPVGVKRAKRFTPEAAPRWERVNELLNEVLELEPAARDEFLRHAAAGEPALYREVGSLLAAHERGGALDRLERDVSPLVAGVRQQAVAEPVPAPAADAAPVTRRYEILEQLGGGGMGVVYKARDTRLERVVALKFLSPHLSSDGAAKERFLVEAKAAGGLDHPNICTVHEVGETEDGRLFIAMPLYGGETLRERIARGPLPVAEALDVALQVARGLAAAHARGIVHRDIKPANLVLTPDGLVKILDFGLAKRPELNLTRSGATLGTVAYMSPEQARGESVDERTDLWSLGVVLYEMLTGVRPFRAGSEHLVAHAILEREPVPASSLRPELPAELDEVLARTLAKPPEKRYPSAAELGRALAAVRQAPLAAGAVPTAAEPPAPAVAESSSAQRSGSLAPEGERRQASILVSCLSGYSDLLERLDPEELDALLQAVRESAESVVEGHGGVLNAFDPEEIVALFGVDATHEDDVVRATRAALELHAGIRELCLALEPRIGCDIRLRSGLGSGLVIAQPASRGEAAYRVTGEAVRVAGRLASHAARDEVLVSPETARLTLGFFETEPLPPRELFSGAAPVAPHRVLRATELQSRLEAAERVGLTRYTGRHEELSRLGEYLDQAEQGEGQLVAIVGDAGLGKSRLLYEFRRGLDTREHRLLHGRCRTPDAGQVSYLPFTEALRQALGLSSGSATLDPQLVVSRLEQAVPELAEFTPLYLHLLPVEHPSYPLPKHLEGEQLRIAMVEALAAFFSLSSRRATTILLLEDWHWADDPSRDVLKQLAEIVSAHPMLIACASRPTASPQLWDGGAHPTLRLAPLGRDATVAIMASVLAAAEVEERLGRAVHERTGGNPFFIEEICHALREEGAVRVEAGCATSNREIDRLHLPETVQAVIRTRLDRLDPAAREALRVAAVIGREFSRPVLERALADPSELSGSLETLKTLGIVQQTRLVPEASYRFKHALTVEVAYESLLERQRRLLHAQIGAVLEEYAADRIEEHLEPLVHHFGRAGDSAKAVRYGTRAAERAEALAEFGEALATLEQVERWLLELPAGAERQVELIAVLLRQERLCERLGLRARQQEIIGRLLELPEVEQDEERLAEVYQRQGDLHTLLRHFDEAEEVLERALRIRSERHDPEGERNALRSLGLLRWHQGHSEEAIERMEQALAIDRARDDTEAIVGDLANLASVLNGIGDYDRAQESLEEALELSIVADLPIKRCYILHHLGNVHRFRGELDQALEYLQEAFELTKHWPLPVHSFHLTTIAHIRLQQGHVEESVALYREAVELSRRAKHVDGLAQSLRMLGELLAGLDRPAEALPHLDEAATLFCQLENRETEALLRSRLASAHEKQGRYAAAAAAWQRARELHSESGATRAELDALEGLARVARHEGRIGEAVERFEDALALATRLEQPEKQGALLHSIATLEWSRGGYERALERYQQALAIFEALGDQVHRGVVLNSIGATLNSLGRPEEAVARLEQAVSLHLKTGQRLLEGHALAALGESYARLGKFELAQKAYHDSLELRAALQDRAGEGWMAYQVARIRAAQGLDGREFLTRSASIAAELQDEKLAAACRSLAS